MRLLVCGGRAYADRAKVFAALDRVDGRRPVSVLIHGAARGADTLAAEWAAARGVAIEPYPADWKMLGLIAGPMRNMQMLIEGKPEGVVAFPGGRGTSDMVRRAEAAGVKVWRPYG